VNYVTIELEQLRKGKIMSPEKADTNSLFVAYSLKMYVQESSGIPSGI